MDSLNYDVFISYARRDNAEGFVSGLRDAIYDSFREFSSEPFRIFFDLTEIHSRQDWELRLRQGLRCSRVLLICLSPNYLRSSYCHWEWDEFAGMQARRIGGGDAVTGVHVAELDGEQQYDAEIGIWRRRVERVQLEQMQAWFPNGVHALQEPPVRQRVKALGFEMHQQLRQARLAKAAPGNLRRHNPGFVGRTSELRALRSQLTGGAAGVVCVVHGIGGMGKSELAVTYAHTYAHAYQGGTWQVDAEGHTDILEAIATLATFPELGLEILDVEQADRRQVGRRVLARLMELTVAARRREEGTGACFLLLDNMSESKLVSESQISALPDHPWFHFAATTRLGTADMGAAGATGSISMIEVGPLGPEDALALIREHQPARDAARLVTDFSSAQEAESAAAIVTLLDAYTLAVEQAAVYLGISGYEPSRLLEVLRARGSAVLDEVGTSADGAGAIRHKEKLAGTIVDQTLQRLSQRARAALAYASMLPPDTVPWHWLRQLTEPATSREPLALPGLSDGGDWTSARRVLEGRRLLTLGDDARFARVHRVLHQHLRHRLVDWELEQCLDAHLQNEVRELESAATPDSALLAVTAAALSSRLKDGQHELAGTARLLLDLAKYRVNVATVKDLTTATYEAYERLTTDDPNNDQYRRGLSMSAQAVGELLTERGDTQAALDCYTRALRIDEQLAAAEPDDADRAYELTVSTSRLADLLGRRGEAKTAFEQYSQALEITESLLTAYPEVGLYQRQRANVVARMADLLAARGDVDAALEHCTAGLNFTERLAAANPNSNECQRDLSLCLVKVGGLRALRGDASAAHHVYTRALNITEQLAAADLGNMQYQRDLSEIIRLVGGLFADSGDAEIAFDHYNRSLKITEQLAATDPNNLEYQRDLSVNLEKGGELLAEVGQIRAALNAYTRAVNIDDRITAADPNNTQYQRDLSVDLEKVGDLLCELEDIEGARDHYSRSRRIAERLAGADRDNLRYQRDLAITTLKFAHTLEALDDSGAVGEWLRAHQILRALDLAGKLLDDDRRFFDFVTLKVEGTPEDLEEFCKSDGTNTS